MGFICNLWLISKYRYNHRARTQIQSSCNNKNTFQCMAMAHWLNAKNVQTRGQRMPFFISSFANPIRLADLQPYFELIRLNTKQAGLIFSLYFLWIFPMKYESWFLLKAFQVPCRGHLMVAEIFNFLKMCSCKAFVTFCLVA